MTQYSSREMIERLVAFPTVSSNSNLDLISFVETYLSGFGIESRRVPNDDGRKTNLYATIGPKVAGGVVLHAHTDVVPVDGQTWDTDPFRITERDGKLFGRGTADMKSFAAIALSLLPDMIAADLKRPIHIALSYDEEVGCLGAPSMIADMADNLPPVEATIVGEPTLMDVVTAHKGFIGFRTIIKGHSVHSSQLNRGVSAVLEAARLIVWLNKRMETLAGTSPRDEAFDPSYSTFHCGTVQGGTAHNIVAKDCSFLTDIRTLPDQDPRQHYADFQAECARAELRMRQVAPETEIRTELITLVNGLSPEVEGPSEELARRITGDNGKHAVVYGTEAGQYQDKGFSAIVCGPGSIDQAHQPNEFIAVEQVDKGERFVRDIIRILSV